MDLEKIYKEMISRDGVKNVFEDAYYLSKFYGDDGWGYTEEALEDRMMNRLYGIINSIIWLDKNEKGEEKNIFVYELHESLCLRFNSMVLDSIHFFKEFHNSENDIVELLQTKFILSEKEKWILSLKWFDGIKTIIAGIVNNANSLEVYGNANKVNSFALVSIGGKQQSLISEKSIIEDGGAIISKPYFCPMFLYLLEYLNLLLKYSCIYHYNIRNYDEFIKNIPVNESHRESQKTKSKYFRCTLVNADEERFMLILCEVLSRINNRPININKEIISNALKNLN